MDIKIYRHSVSHILASAIMSIYPQAKLGIGPATDEGFYYDIDLDYSITAEDFGTIEAKMQQIIDSKQPFVCRRYGKHQAIEMFVGINQAYKVDLLSTIDDDEVSVYENGEFIDLCRGPHVENTAEIKAFKLLKVAGAYWRGSEKNKMLQRIYGTAFFTQSELSLYLNLLDEAKKRDHRRLGKELDLFSFQDEGPGFVFWHPRGMSLYNKIVNYWKSVHVSYGYEEIKTPIVLHESLWHQSGHWDNYKDNMYFVEIDEQRYSIKPMNCPGGILVYKNSAHSYKELPIRHTELGLVHRHERSGVLHGLFRVRQFTQDDGHIYCTADQIEDEIVNIIKLLEEIYKTFGFENYEVELSTKPEKSIGTQEMWNTAEQALRQALAVKGIQYKLNEGDGAFYGPKIDFHIKDSLGRSWQCGTIQLDFSMPERFELSYIGEDGNKHQPVMIHRAILGSLERFVGILLEHYAGALPLWLAPIQVVLIPISEKNNEFAQRVATSLKKNGLTVKVDARNEKMGYRIRDAEIHKVPYTLVVGDKEVESGLLSVRSKKRGQLGNMTVDELLLKLNHELTERI